VRKNGYAKELKINSYEKNIDFYEPWPSKTSPA